LAAIPTRSPSLANPRAVRIGKALFAKALTDTRPRSVRWHAHHGPWRLQAPAPFQQAIAAAGSTVYLYDWNQTVLDPFLTQVVRHGTHPHLRVCLHSRQPVPLRHGRVQARGEGIQILVHVCQHGRAQPFTLAKMASWPRLRPRDRRASLSWAVRMRDCRRWTDQMLTRRLGGKTLQKWWRSSNSKVTDGRRGAMVQVAGKMVHG
jgi:hypothetical protein